MAYSDNTESDIIVPKKWYEKLPREAWSNYEKIPQPDPWFEVYKLTDTVYAIYEDGHFEEVISYLVLGNEKAALIDTANGIGDIKSLVEKITDLPVMVVNTHTHVDHVGGNHQFKMIAAPDTEFSKEQAKNGRTKAQMGHYLDGDMVWKPFPEYFDAETWMIRPFKVTRWLKDGDKIDLGGIVLDVIFTPGHSPDSICLLDRENKIFWTGDSFYPAPIYVYSPTTNLDQFIESFAKMVKYMPQYEWVMPSHNEPKIEKHLIKECYEAAKKIKAGTAGEYTEGVASGIKVHRYDYGRFSLVVRAER
ncbi:MBL fold metallo-hydrolase [Candidatus Bathyarchaeota archaeon]|nr:MBL fold metallo-hydrolase [Candidatus Bathyarchaeota archaeon]TFH18557.1 MAG: MBL fold metallo-hydrolase [Candidatus Bathyarchaeota archaeon]